ncbi:hypothetical protein DPQ33_06815 [Oceanidesulfovibrio indonesiensis]|uniref:MarR family transcriptional regulator n=1 Tax=Oceanidesulfovibrio indonesiensis TaxID=54767 RepID=A0A7M3MGT1_9BACT|nr:DUF2250 domain-containing protein [Oceanidesulfovibrio indonesiensis]TVM18449.1 hypothetical protein DPQ33_06815 [Oceanidesulfovibrio indonesiensis]
MPKPNETQTKIVYYLQNVGPAYVKKLAEVLGLEESQWDEVRAEIRALESAGLVERVPGAFVTYQTPEGGTVTKHMNHTYYRSTKKGKRFVRDLAHAPDVPLTPVYKRASR